ncbi:hypothetical protein ACTJJB_15725 [Chitinophaga sp. 22536]|uniref:hypothetical protein n=1 Tax=unclassified Chitinophaga TaxID=2619133 RepID=UPI003F872EF1
MQPVMKAIVRYILLLFFLIGFTFTGHNKAPLLSARAANQSYDAGKNCSDTLLSTKDCLDFLQLFSFVNDETSDDESDVFHVSRFQRFTTLFAAYYQALFLTTDNTVLTGQHRFMHPDAAVKPVPRFIMFHTLIIPSHLA